MSLKLNQSMLEENIALKRENNKLLARIDDMNILLKKVSEQVTELSNRPLNTTTVVVKGDSVIESAPKLEGNIFIPSPSSDGMVSNIGEIKIKTRKSDIAGSADKLSKINESK